MRINKRQLKEWIAALDSGNFKQTKNALQDEKGYCCLGVGCVVFIKPGKRQLNEKRKLAGALPNDQVNAPEWLKHINNNFRDKTGVRLSGLNDASHLDDNGVCLEPFTLSEIATLIELVYIHKILD